MAERQFQRITPEPDAEPAPSSAAAPVRAPLLPPKDHWFTPNDFQVSPNGRRVAFVAAGGDGVGTLWVSLESSQSSEIDGNGGAVTPFWSPDSRWIAFFAGGRLMKVEPGGAGLSSAPTRSSPASRANCSRRASSSRVSSCSSTT